MVEPEAMTFAEVSGDTEIDELRARIAALEAESERRRSLLEISDNRVNRLATELEAANARADALGDQLAELRAKWPEVEAQSVYWIDRAESAEAEADRQYHDLSVRLDEGRRLLRETEARLAAAEDVSEAYHLELADAAERTREIEVLKARLAEMEEQRNTALDNARVLSAQLVEISEVDDEMERRCDHLREILRDVWNQFAIEKPDGTKWAGGLSTLEGVAAAMQGGPGAKQKELPQASDLEDIDFTNGVDPTEYIRKLRE